MDPEDTSKELFAEFGEGELLTMDGFDDCIVGVVERCGSPLIVCYDKEKVITKLRVEWMVGYEDATDHFYFNQIGAWMGDATPCFLTTK